MTRKTRLTLLLSVSEYQAQAMAALPVAWNLMDAEGQRRAERLIARRLAERKTIAGVDMVCLTDFGHAALSAYRAAHDAKMLREVL